MVVKVLGWPPVVDPVSSFKCSAKDYADDYDNPWYGRHTPASELFDLTSIVLTWDRDSVDHKNIQIFGHIIMMDDLGNQFPIFHRYSHEPLTPCVSLSMSYVTATIENFQLDGPRCLPRDFCLVICLKEKFSGLLLVDVVEHIDCARLAYDQISFVEYNPTSCRPRVKIEFIAFQNAIMADVGFIIEKIGTRQSDDDVDDAHVISHMSAIFRARNKSNIEVPLQQIRYYRYLKARDKSNIELPVHDDECSSSKDHEFGEFIHLSSFAFPAYSELRIKALFDINDELCYVNDENDERDLTKKCLVFKPNYAHLKGEFLEQQIVGINYRVRVLVRWAHSSFFLPESKTREWRDPKRTEILERVHHEEVAESRLRALEVKRLISKCDYYLSRMKKELFYPIFIHPMLNDLRKREWRILFNPEVFVEVFSICVWEYGSTFDDPKTLNLSGKIDLKYSGGEERIFEEHVPVACCESVPLKPCVCCYQGPNFSIKLQLFHGRREMSNGFLEYCLSTHTSWVNRRLCSIVKGKHGFAAVHHTIFEDAIGLNFKFILQCNSGGPLRCQAYGRINARYGNFRYSTPYEKKYYQSTLFDKHDSDAVDIVDGEVPLSKSAVAVPSNGSLIVIVHVNVLINGECEALKYSFEVTLENLKYSNKILGSKFSLLVFADLDRVCAQL